MFYCGPKSHFNMVQSRIDPYLEGFDNNQICDKNEAESKYLCEASDLACTLDGISDHRPVYLKKAEKPSSGSAVRTE